jgi:3-hydroxyacyl-[acyl-carrier-protein] dehydratase
MPPPRLPQGPQFRLLDEVSAPGPGPSLTGRTWLNPDWPIFHDHFPGQPLLPAVYFVEMAAQAAGVLWAAEAGFSPATPLQVVEIRKFRIRRPARPGQTLQTLVRMERAWPQLAAFHAQIMREDVVLAEGEITMANVPVAT